MSLFGMDEDQEEKEIINDANEEITARQPEKKKKPFAYWKVKDREFRLKLTTEQTCRLEEKYRRNLLDLLMQSGSTLPPLGIMLTVIQAAMTPWEHGVKLKDIQKVFDIYVEGGGTQLTLFSDVVMQILMVSGFFTENQQEEMNEKLDEVKESL